MALGAQHALDLARAVIEAEDGLRAAADAAQRHRYHEHKTLHDGGHSDEQIALPRAAIALQYGVHCDDHGIVHRDDGERRKAQKQYAADDGAFQARSFDADRRSPVQQEAQRVGAAERL